MLGVLKLTPVGLAVATLYQVATTVRDINEFIDRHIDTLKASDNRLISATGRVLEGAKFGFGLGYISSVTLIAVGQYLLGNTAAALGTVATGAVLANPVAMTCASMGAIYYGWAALSDAERNDLLENLARGLEMGRELIRSLVDFAIGKTRDLLDSSQLQEFKAFIAVQAAQFGRSLYDVTHQVADFVKGTAARAGDLAGLALAATSTAVKDAATFTGQAASKAADATVDAARTTGRAAGQVASKVGDVTGQAAEATASAVKDAAKAVSETVGTVAGKAGSTAAQAGTAVATAVDRALDVLWKPNVISTVPLDVHSSTKSQPKIDTPPQ